MSDPKISDVSPDDILRAKLNMETSAINWLELQRHFAAGRVVAVSEGTDLIEVAFQLTRDNKARFQQWIADGSVAGVSTEQAERWYQEKADLWAVVVAPWVLVQEHPASH